MCARAATTTDAWKKSTKKQKNKNRKIIDGIMQWILNHSRLLSRRKANACKWFFACGFWVCVCLSGVSEGIYCAEMHAFSVIIIGRENSMLAHTAHCTNTRSVSHVSFQIKQCSNCWHVPFSCQDIFLHKRVLLIFFRFRARFTWEETTHTLTLTPATVTSNHICHLLFLNI